MNTSNNTWGGKRAGAGRPRGARNRKTREFIQRIEAEGWAPLDLMLHVMRGHAAAGSWNEAAAIAKDIAPYVHPKIARIQPIEAEGAEPINHVVVHFVKSPKENSEEIAQDERISGHTAGTPD